LGTRNNHCEGTNSVTLALAVTPGTSPIILVSSIMNIACA
jgi:hypothetical protein